MEVSNVADIWPEFMARLQQAIYCNMATIDQQDRPRSRMMHPIWELAANNPTGWVISWPQTHKAKHLARNPSALTRSRTSGASLISIMGC